MVEEGRGAETGSAWSAAKLALVTANDGKIIKVTAQKCRIGVGLLRRLR